MHPSVMREIYGTGRGSRLSNSENRVKSAHAPRRHVAIALLMMVILSGWALDLLHVRIVPLQVHESVASFIDSQRGRWPMFSWLPDVDTTVAHNPLDDSPINFGSVLLMGALCVAGLAGLGFSTPNNKPK